MISLLIAILKGVSEFGTYVAAGSVTVLNLLFAAVAVTVNAAIALLPSISVGETKLAGGLLEELNWFFPFGGIVTVLTTMLTAYLIWMGVRYILRLVRAA
jgi:hypothetical protein